MEESWVANIFLVCVGRNFYARQKRQEQGCDMVGGRADDTSGQRGESTHFTVAVQAYRLQQIESRHAYKPRNYSTSATKHLHAQSGRQHSACGA